MKRLVLFSVLLAACSPVAPADSSAQAQTEAPPAADWTDPSGRVLLYFADAGWRELNPPMSGSIFDIEPTDRAGALRCSVLAPRPFPLHGGSQQQLNAQLDARTAAEISPAWSANADFGFEHASVDGVSVIDMRFSDGRMYQRWRMLRMPEMVGSAQFDIGCAGTLPVSDADKQRLEAIVTSLRIATDTP
jgi:hypothetical protein